MSVNNYLIPLISTPQTFEIQLAGVVYTITSKWNNQVEGGWVIDIGDANAVSIACNIPLITGGDCLEGLEYLGIQGSLYVLTTGASPFDVPTFSNLGVESSLYFQTDNPDE